MCRRRSRPSEAVLTGRLPLRIPGAPALSGLSVLLAIACGGTSSIALTQEPPPRETSQRADTTRAYELEAVVVTAERARAPLVTSTSAVSRISAADLRRQPLLSLAEALQQAPGLVFLDFGGLGEDPQLTIRGFYGGGEAEYAVVLLDGVPLNGFEGGLVNWDLIPVTGIRAIEVVRGGASSLYGDAAVGGVINLITRGTGASTARASLSGGQFGLLRGAASIDGAIAGRPVSLFGELRRSEGFRDHAGRRAGSIGASLSLPQSRNRSVHLSTLHHWRELDEPGPLSAADLDRSRTGSSPFYRFDNTRERLHRLTLDVQEMLAPGTQASGYLVGEIRGMEAIRTLPLSPQFADTKRRDLDNARLLGSVQLQIEEPGLPWDDRLLLGVDWAAGRLETEHHALVSGGVGVYRSTKPGPGELDARGSGSRLVAGAFGRYELRPGAAVRITMGGRVDWLRDTFAPRAPSEGEQMRAEHLAFSPKAGMNLRYLRSARQEGHVFASVGRSFKAPTPDQLFDQRSIPVPFPPFRISLSNELLSPQYGTSLEAGLYHRIQRSPHALVAEISLAGYQIEMKDELDFSLEELRYVNIGRSRHRGLESGLRLGGLGPVSAFASYTLQSATSRFGEDAGKYLKAIPRHALSAGVDGMHRSGLASGVGVTHARGIHLDDANTLTLPGYTRVDGKLSFPIRQLRLSLEVFNLLDREYSTTGFPDPAGTGVVYYYPAAGRFLQVGLSTGW